MHNSKCQDSHALFPLSFLFPLFHQKKMKKGRKRKSEQANMNIKCTSDLVDSTLTPKYIYFSLSSILDRRLSNRSTGMRLSEVATAATFVSCPVCQGPGRNLLDRYVNDHLHFFIIYISYGHIHYSIKTNNYLVTCQPKNYFHRSVQTILFAKEMWFILLSAEMGRI